MIICAIVISIGYLFLNFLWSNSKFIITISVNLTNANIIHDQIIKVLNNFNLKQKIISYSADNTNTNYGGLQRIKNK